jgi:hypothetical protein
MSLFFLFLLGSLVWNSSIVGVRSQQWSCCLVLRAWCALELVEHESFLSVFIGVLGLEFVHCGCEESAMVLLFGLEGLEVGRR